MSSRLKFLAYLFMILLLIAAYHDLNPDRSQSKMIGENSSTSNYDNKSLNFQVVSYQINSNEQLLSIMEKLNPNSVMNIEEFIIDFQALNPTTDIYQLKAKSVYLFPIYY